MIVSASVTGRGLVAWERSWRVAAAINSKPSSGTPTSRSRPGQTQRVAQVLHGVCCGQRGVIVAHPGSIDAHGLGDERLGDIRMGFHMGD